MKITTINIAIILSIGIMLTGCGNSSTTTNEQPTVAQDTTTKAANIAGNSYEDLRKMAFGVTAKELGIKLPDKQTIVYGVIMDWGMQGGTATVVSFKTGDASLFLSSGGGIIGGGNHENVSNSVSRLLKLAQTFLDKTTKTNTNQLPAFNEVKFYLLTNKGMFVGQEEIKNFENKSSVWVKLFEEENKVLNELRKTNIQ